MTESLSFEEKNRRLMQAIGFEWKSRFPESQCQYMWWIKGDAFFCHAIDFFSPDCPHSGLVWLLEKMKDAPQAYRLCHRLQEIRPMEGKRTRSQWLLDLLKATPAEIAQAVGLALGLWKEGE